MKRKLIFKFSAACLTALLFTFAGCQDKDYYDPTKGPDGDSDSPSLLDFSTSQEVKLNLTYDVSAGFIAVFDVYTENPLAVNSNGAYELKSNLTPIAGGICVDGKINLTKTVPAYAKELYVYSPSLFVPELMYAPIEAGVANFGLVDLSVKNDEDSSTRSFANNKIDGYLSRSGVSSSMDIHIDADGWGNRSTYKPRYVVETKEIAAKYKNRIANAFPDRTAVTNKDYYKDAVLHLYEPAEIKLAMVRADATYLNTLSYFFYTGTPAEINTVDKSKIREIVAIPYAKLDKTNGLKIGDMVQLMYYDSDKKQYVKEFPTGTTIGFMLRSNAFVEPAYKNSYKPSIDQSKNVFYSANDLNADKAMHTIFFDAALETEKDETFICFGFEDTYGGGDNDCNDVMFHLDINPADAIEQPPHVPEVGTIYHTENRKGVLAFEDNWPTKGDYDMNDVVVNYTSKTTYQQKTEDAVPVGAITLKSLDDKITLAHSGADFTNSFAYKVNVNPSLIEKITVDDVAYKSQVDGNGFIVKITSDVAHEVQSVKMGIGYTCTPKTFNVKVDFTDGNGITQAAFNDNKLYAPYNPFIIPDNKEGYEVHLPYYPPTDAADQGMFNSDDDKSDPSNNIWYVGSVDNPYPFAIHLLDVEAFKKIPTETESIDKTYSKFNTWVASKFTSDLDWYNYPN